MKARKAAMATLAEAETEELLCGLAAVTDTLDYILLRPLETGLVMLQGRIGGDGAAFNLGEATVTRAAVRIASGEIGFAYVLGRDHDKAQRAAICDALWQSDLYRDAVEDHILTPIRERHERERLREREETAATRVDFFTLLRGEG